MSDKTSPLLDRLAAEADDAAVAEQTRRQQAWDRREKDERYRAAVSDFFEAEAALDPARIYQTLRVACAALAETGRLTAWGHVDHEQTYRKNCIWNNRVMPLPTYRAARLLFEAACNGALAEDELVQAWQKESLRYAFRWLRLFLYGLTGEAIILCNQREGVVPLAPEPASADHAFAKRKGMSVAEANAEASKLAKRIGKAFFDLSEREQARRIGTTWRTWSQTPLFRQAKKRKEKLQTRLGKQRTGSKSPPVVGFTDTIEAVAREDKSLQELIADQQQDNEPSPLEDDPPDTPRRKVYTRKKL